MSNWNVEQAHKYIDAVVGERDAANKKLAEISTSLAGGTIMEIKPYQMVRQFYSQHWEPQKVSVGEVERIYAQDLETIKENEVAVENNKKIYDTLYAVFRNLGFRETVTERTNPRTFKTKEVTAGWLRSLNTIERSTGASKVHDLRTSVLKRIQEHKDAEERSRKHAAQEREVAIQKAEKLKYIGQLEAKYGQKFHSEDDAIDYLLSRDKYLKLAYYLAKNRGDWSEGSTYAQIGIEGFAVENDTDKEILAEISELISDWDFDGRCFRDCKWNYNVLYEMADKELHAELDKLQ
jgi:hypothetical protein